MSTITVPNLKIGDAINSKPINNFISSVNSFEATASSFKPEGIDRRNIQPQITHDYKYWRADYSTPLEFTTTSFTKLNNGTQDIEIGPVTVPAGQAFHLCASFNFYGEVAATRLGPNGRDKFTFALGYDTGSGVSVYSQTRRQFSVVAFSSVPSPNRFMVNANSCTIELMDSVSSDTTYRFYIMGKTETVNNVFPNKVLIDSVSFYYVRYLV